MINLIPPEEKKELAENKKQKLIIICGFLGFLFCLSLVLGLVSVKFYVAGQNLYQTVFYEAAQKEFSSHENQEIKKEIISFRRDIDRINAFYAADIDLTFLLEKFISALNPGVLLKSISYQSETASFNITGFSEKREDLLLFKNNIENDPAFKNIEFPPASWVKSENVDFSAIFKAKTLKNSQ